MESWQEIVKWSIAVHVLLIGGGLLMLVLVSGMLRHSRNPATSAAWLMFMFILPYAGIPLYLFFGSRKLAALHQRKAQLFAGDGGGIPLPEDQVQRYLQAMGVQPPVAVGRMRLHEHGEEAWRALCGILRSAQRSLDLCVFILADDAVGREVLAILTARAEQGVRVRLLLDGVGSFLLPKRRLKPLLQAGGRVAWFVPVLHLPLRGRTNLRNHRKLVIADAERVWAGGRNIAVEYLQSEARSHWYDLSFDLSGAAALRYRNLFEADWCFATHEQAAFVPAVSGPSDAAGAQLQLVPSGPDMAQDVLHDLLVTLVAGARKSIIAVSPYFVPGDVLQTVLCLAARRGVKLDLILPASSNHRLADFARNRFLRQLVEAGAGIWLLPDAMLHAKGMVIDDRYALTGSANLDLRSLFLNFELMTLMYGRSEIEHLAQWIAGLRARCRRWQPQPAGVVRETLEGLVLLTSFQL